MKRLLRMTVMLWLLCIGLVVGAYAQCNPITVTADAPFTENFEAYSSSASTSYNSVGSVVLPSCWNAIYTGSKTGFRPHLMKGNSSYHSQSTCVILCAGKVEDYGSNTYLILPAVTNNLATLRLAFDFDVESLNYGALTVGYMTNPNDANTFTVIQSSIQNCTSPERRVIDLSNVTTTGNVHIAFRWSLTSSSYWCATFDNIELSLAPDCPAPTNLAVTSFEPYTEGQSTKFKCNFSWQDASSATAYEYTIVSAGTTPTWTGITTVVTASTTGNEIASLEPNTSYDLYVRANNCTNAAGLAGSRETAGPFTITTPCLPLQLPYTNDFTDLTASTSMSQYNSQFSDEYFPSCWTIPANQNGSYDCRAHCYSASYTDYNNVLCMPAGDAAIGCIAVFPLFVNPISDIEILFDAKRSSSYATNGTFSIGYYYNNTYTELQVVSNLSSDTWNQYNYTISDLVQSSIPTSARLAFRYKYATNSTYAVFVDNITVSRAPDCPVSTGLMATNVTSSSATLTWNANGSTSWIVAYGAPGFNPEASTTTTQTVTTNSLTLNNLIPNTSYEFYVKPVCPNNGLTYWSDVASFTTPCVASSLPFSADFTGLPASTSLSQYNSQFLDEYFPSCWAMPTNQNGNYDCRAHVYSGYASNDDNVLAMPAGDATIGCIAVLPPLEGNLNDLQVLFDAKLNSSYATDGTFSLGYYEGYTYTVLEDISDLSVIWNTYSYTISDLAQSSIPTGARLAFRYKYATNSTYAALVDNIIVRTAPDCEVATNLATTNITTTSATLTWSANGSTAWIVAYGAQGFNPDASTATTQTVTTNSLALSGLTHSTSYDFYVKPVCPNDGITYWSNVCSFNTLCDLWTAPWRENFDNPSFPPSCWSTAHIEGPGTYLWQRETSTTYGGSAGSAKLPDMREVTKTNLVTPLTYIPTANSYQVSFRINRTTAYADKTREGVKVWVNTSPDTIGATPLIHIRRNITQGEITETAAGWYQYFATIPTSGNVYIIFEGISEYGNSTYIDDIEIANCYPPTNLVVSNVMSSSAQVGWRPHDNETSWMVYWSTVNGVADSAVVDATPNYTISNLTPSTAYTVKVKSLCSPTDHSYYSDAVTFRTLCASMTLTANAPFVENFDDEIVNVTTQYAPMPTCWNYIYAGLSLDNAPRVVNTGETPTPRNNALEMEASIDNFHGTSVALLPTFSNPMEDLKVKFTTKMSDGNATLQLGYVSYSNGTQVFTELSSITTATTVEQHDLIVSDYLTASQTIPAESRLAFQLSSTGYSSTLYIDDVEVSLYHIYDTVNVRACDSYTAQSGQVYTESGVSVHTVTEAECQRHHVEIIQIDYSATVEVSTEVCDSYVWNDTTITTSGQYVKTFQTTAGCDSVVTLNLTVNDSKAGEMSVTACDSYTWCGDTYTASGDYSKTLTAANTCDSVATLHLTILTSTHNVQVAENCDSYEWHGETYTTSGTYLYQYENDEGCASVDTLKLTIYPSYQHKDTLILCQSALPYVWHGQSLTAGGDYTADYQSLQGCDSTYMLHLTINDVLTSDTAATTCDSYTWYGTTYTASGDYTQTFTAANGCDSLITLHLTIKNSVTGDTAATACDSYTWYGTTYTMSNDYTKTFTAANGCDSVVTLHLTINNSVTGNASATACDSYTWYGTTYTTSGDYNTTLTTVNGCDSVVTLHLTINNSVTGDTAAVACDSYTWYGTTYTASGDYTTTLTAANGCDSVVTLHLTINNSVTGDTVAVACDSYTWYGTEYTVSGDYNTTLTAANGCDSVVTLHLTINNSLTGDTSATACDRYTWYGETYTTSGDYTTTLTTVNGCDSVVTLHLTLRYSVTGDTSAVACDSYTWYGETYTTSGDYTTTLTAANGCDSVVTLHLTIHYSLASDTSAVVCNRYAWYGTTYTRSGDYTTTLTTVDGCDSVVTLHLTIHYSVTTVDTVVACDSYNWHGTTYTRSGDYVKALTTVNGCDSIVMMHLTIKNSVTGNTVALACDSYTWYGTEYTASGDYTTTLTAANGCDSVVTLHLTINNSVTGETAAEACDSYTWYGETYTASGDYTTTLTAANGCDSVVTLHLTIHNSVTSDTSATACDSYTWYGTTYTTSGDYAKTFTTVNGCDSVVTLHLTINHAVTGDTAAVACDSYTWYGTTYTTSGDYTRTFTAANGCDSVVTLHLTVNHAVTGDTAAVACDSYTWYGEIYTTSGNYTKTLTAASGCDSVVTLHLTIHHSITGEISAMACNSYTWYGETYTTSGDYTTTIATANGCDCIVTLHLTINYSVTGETTATACDSYTWYGTTYTTSGDYTTTLTAANGCDSVVTLHLTINNSVTGETTAEACDSYTWYGETYTASGDYTTTLTAANGCDSVVTLHLTIHNSVASSITAVACDSYTWYSTDYTTSGNYTTVLTAANGCDSVVTLHLTIHNSVTGETTAEACDSYTWNGTTYTTSGDYATTLTTTNGCDSIAILHLTIHNSVAGETTVAACDSYTWNGEIYTMSGDYSWTGQTINGCDSTVVLHLTINPSYNVAITDTAYVGEPYNGYGISQTFTEATTQEIAITETTQWGCDSIINLTIVVLDRTGVADFALAQGVTVYPNPAESYFEVVVPTGRMEEVALFDNAGRRILLQKVDHDHCRIEVAHFTPGVYYLQVRTDRAVVMKKVIIK